MIDYLGVNVGYFLRNISMLLFPVPVVCYTFRHSNHLKPIVDHECPALQFCHHPVQLSYQSQIMKKCGE